MTTPDPTTGDSRNTDQTPTSAGAPLSSGRMFAPALEETARVPEVVGAYRIEHRIGRGGMGTVYAATRLNSEGPSIQARAAVKVLRRGIDTEDVLKRFDLERQVLRAMDHPNIARFFDAGETDDGLPYVIMEFVEGQPIDQFCDGNSLSIEDRLKLFSKVCSAVQYAHTNLIVHRDIKPANILVTTSGEPKLLDFGIAKILNPHLAVAQLVTGPTVRLMTPEYASPEQVRGEPITTTSDIYSLGVLLYELLTGVRPYRIPQRIEREIVRIVCDTMPDRPSTAFRRLVTEAGDGEPKTDDGRTLDDIARKRSLRPGALRSRLAGELDDIIMTALAKTPAGRYRSADDLSDDIRRYLTGQPVSARKVRGRHWYELKKFAARNRTAVAATLAGVLALSVGGSVAAVQWSRAVTAERDQALAEQARLTAEADAAVADRIRADLWDRITYDLKYFLEPVVLERFHTAVIGNLNDLVTAYPEADPAAVRLAVLEARTQLAGALGGDGGGNLRDPERALAVISEAEASLGVTKPDELPAGERLAFVKLLREKGNALRDIDRSEDAASVYEQALLLVTPVARQAEDADLAREAVREIGRLELVMAQLADQLCQWVRAEELYDRTIRVRQEAVEQNSDDLNLLRDLAVALGNQGDFLIRRGDFSQAESVIRRSLSIRQRLLQRRPDHPSLRRDVAVARIFLGMALSGQRLHEDARTEWDRAIEKLAELRVDYPQDARLVFTVVTARLAAAEDAVLSGDADRAEATCREFAAALDEHEAMAPEDGVIPRYRAQLAFLFGRTQQLAGDAEGAKVSLRSAYDQTDALLQSDPQRGTYNRQAAEIARILGDLTLDSGDSETAGAWYRRARTVYDDLASRSQLCGVPQADIDHVQEKMRTLSR